MPFRTLKDNVQSKVVKVGIKAGIINNNEKEQGFFFLTFFYLHELLPSELFTGDRIIFDPPLGSGS